GLVLLIVGQFATDMLSNESALHLFEGESKNYSEDFHANELVLVDSSAPEQEHVISIPESVVAKKGEIRDSRLPVTLRVRDYWRNCDVQDRAPSEAINPGADHGIYTNMLLLPLPDSKDKQGRAAALVEVMSGAGLLGNFLLPTRSQERQTFRINNADYS